MRTVKSEKLSPTIIEIGPQTGIRVSSRLTYGPSDESSALDGSTHPR